MSTKAPAVHGRATPIDLMSVSEKAELIAGRIVPLMPTGLRLNLVAGRIYRSLADYADATGSGVALTDNIGYVVPELPSGRESFSPDASFYVEPVSTDDMRFLKGPPAFAVEVRSEGDYGPSAERDQAAKRADYFRAGTAVVWDVDPIEDRIAIYRSDAPDRPTIIRRGQEADAEPAVPGWRIAADRVFP